MTKKPDMKADIDDVRADVFSTVVTEAIRFGYLDPRGKTDEELLAAVREWVKSWPEEMKFSISTDHRSVLLRHGRQFLKSGEYHLAALLFATWTEHWVNAVIHLRCRALGLGVEDVTAIIRPVPLAGKITWLFRLLGSKKIYPRHRSAILRLADLRNSYVHYKWKMFDTEEKDPGEAEIRKAVEQYEGTLRYLQAYESKHMLHSASHRISKLTSRER